MVRSCDNLAQYCMLISTTFCKSSWKDIELSSLEKCQSIKVQVSNNNEILILLSFYYMLGLNVTTLCGSYKLMYQIDLFSVALVNITIQGVSVYSIWQNEESGMEKLFMYGLLVVTLQITTLIYKHWKQFTSIVIWAYL